ncbi:hypothetical protein K438DRAFT_1991010 [Mycena galopus ATCC 62051]|nr:hypothetical protein K438DRAFT_1991010 [Mycena galopus ATCC 62051]
MSSAPLTPLPDERLEQDLADAQERLATAVADLQTKETAHLKVQRSRAKKARKDTPRHRYEAAQHTHEQALAAVSAAEQALDRGGPPSPSQIDKALQSHLATVTPEAQAHAAAKAKADAQAKAKADANAKNRDGNTKDGNTKDGNAKDGDANAKDGDANTKDREANAKDAEDAEAKAKADAKDGDANAKDGEANAKDAEDAEAKAKADTDAKDVEVGAKDAKAKGATTVDGSDEEEIAKRFQDINAEGSDESDPGSAEVGKKRKRPKTRKVEGADRDHWEQLILQVDHQMENANSLTEAALKDLSETKARAKAELAKATNWDVDDKAEDSDDDDDKLDVEIKWDHSFSADDGSVSRRFLNSGQAWRDKVLRRAEEAVDNFLKDPKHKANKIPLRLRRLMRMVAEAVPRCATASKELALHILTTQQGKTNCRFHDLKRSTKGAKGSDGPGLIVGVAYGKDAVPTEDGFFHCGCDEKAALWEFFWFKTWTVQSANPKIKGVDRMRGDASDVLSVRQHAFFSQAFTAATFLEISDMYSIDPPSDSLEHFTRLRRLQVDRTIFVLNQSLPEDCQWEYALAKKTKEKKDVDGDVPIP